MHDSTAPEMAKLGYALYDREKLKFDLKVPFGFNANGPPKDLSSSYISCQSCNKSHEFYWFVNKDDPKKNQYCSICADDRRDDIPDAPTSQRLRPRRRLEPPPIAAPPLPPQPTARLPKPTARVTRSRAIRSRTAA